MHAIKYRRAQYSTVQYSTVQCSAVKCIRIPERGVQLSVGSTLCPPSACPDYALYLTEMSDQTQLTLRSWHYRWENETFKEGNGRTRLERSYRSYSGEACKILQIVTKRRLKIQTDINSNLLNLNSIILILNKRIAKFKHDIFINSRKSLPTFK